MKTILAMGQSNMVGAVPGGVWGIPSAVTVWNCAGDSSSATAGLGSAFVTPANMSVAPFIGKNNLAIHACRYLASELGEDIRLIIVALSGTPIEEWSNPGGAMYARMQAVLAAAGVTYVDAFLWHQGEANAGAPAAYPALWAALLNRMETDGYINVATPIVIGELAIWQTAMNPVLRSIANADFRVSIADMSCFPVFDDNLHFNGPSLVRAGLEYARELMKIPSAFFHPSFDTETYVTAAGAADFTTSVGVPCKVLVKAENGNKALIQGGAFQADRLGVWEFALRGCAFNTSMSLVLLDEAGSIIQFIAGTGGAASGGMYPYTNGDSVVALGKGDRVYLGILLPNGTPGTFSAKNSAWINRMTVRYLGRD
jgi:hypothetical protein